MTGAARQTISAVVLAKNEEAILARCLESVKWADEIIVIDDNSADKTAEIARRYTGKVITRSLAGDFSAQRNAGIDAASCDWILQMDADERVTDLLRENILRILSDNSGPEAFTFRRDNNFCGKFLRYGGEDSHRPLRLFKRGRARFAPDKIHERLLVDGRQGHIDAVMEHYNFPDIHHYVETQDFYSSIEAAALAKKTPLIPLRRLKRELTVEPVKLFIKIYFKKRGYRDGMNGLVFAVLSAWRRFLIYAKYWEMNRNLYQHNDQ